MNEKVTRVLEGRRIIVTGAARGIGRSIADCLADAGAHVVVADILAAQGERAAEEIRDRGGRASAIPVDIADPASARAMVSEALATMGGLDGLVNNAGLDAPKGNGWELSDDDWSRVIDIDLAGAWWCTRAALEPMMATGGGRIVHISSVSARLADPAISPAYAAAKAGLIGLTIALSAQVERFGILVNAITPGPTGSTGQPISEDRRHEYEAHHPLGFGGVEPIAEAVRYLMAPSGDWISGATLNISGGQLRGM
jgi:NAD(P)-dependent dehydrogenase (short-subunit alcohol dehydrogenase family)